MAKRVAYEEGDLFSLPLVGGGYGCAIVARMQRPAPGRRWRQIYLYGFDVCRKLSVDPEFASSLKTANVVICSHTSDLCITNGRWKKLCPMPGFDQRRWPVLPFLGGKRQLCWIDNPEFELLSLDRALIAKEDEWCFDLPSGQQNADALEAGIPLVLKQTVSTLHFRLSPERMAVWQRYHDTLRGAAACAWAAAERKRSRGHPKKVSKQP